MIHNGLQDPVPVGEAKSREWQGIRIGIIGQVGVWKGHEDLLEAFALLAGKYPTAELHIFGSGTPAFEAKLRAQAEKLGLGGRLVWHGFVADRTAIYRQVDICVLPSRAPDPLPTVAIEAAFFGLPVAASGCGGLLEIIEDGVTGYLFEPENPRQLAARLDELLASAPLRLKIGEAARRRAETCFSRERFVADFLRLLDDKGLISSNCALASAPA